MIIIIIKNHNNHHHYQHHYTCFGLQVLVLVVVFMGGEWYYVACGIAWGCVLTPVAAGMAWPLFIWQLQEDTHLVSSSS